MDEESKTKAMEVFELYDANQNGFIEFKEFKNLVKAASKKLGVEISDEAIVNSFEDSDENEDRKISPEEFLKVFESIEKTKTEEI